MDDDEEVRRPARKGEGLEGGGGWGEQAPNASRGGWQMASSVTPLAVIIRDPAH